MSTPSSDLAFIEKYDPTTEAFLARYAMATEDEVQAATQRSQEALKTWRQTSLQARAALLRHVRDAIFAQAQSLGQLISQETGKPLNDALEGDIATTLNVLSVTSKRGPNLLKPSWVQPDLLSLVTGRFHQQHWHPRGVIAVISPWNFPFAIAGSGIAAALMAGNTVLFKPSEWTPGTGEALAQIFRNSLKACGFPVDVVQCLQGDGRVGKALLAQSIDGIIFTGSERTGRMIVRQAVERNLWYSLELGGSDAMIMLEGADLDLAASFALWGRFSNAGQTCAAVKRLLVPAHLEAAFTEILLSKVAKLHVGSPADSTCHLGPLMNEGQRQLIHSQVQDSIERGAKRLCGGKPIPGPGFFYEPTVLQGVPKTARVWQEETFGPVLPIMPYQTTSEAIQLANDSHFGLTASIFGSEKEAQAIARQLTCGTVVINDVGPTNYPLACVPWQGWKQSGPGQSHGEQALRDLCQGQIVSSNLMRHIPLFQKPLWHFGASSASAAQLAQRAQTILSLAARHPGSLHPKHLLTFWRNRASQKL